MDFRTITIFVENGHDITVDLHGKFAQWEIESIIMRFLEKIHDEEIEFNTEEVEAKDEEE